MSEKASATILVVEDNPAMNVAICDILELNAYSVYSANNGAEALALLEEKRPDAVLCDIMMPHMDGYTLLRHTRDNEELRTLPFIFLTARSSPQDKRQAKSIGIEDYLVKPVEPEDLLIAVENALRRSRSVAEETQRQMDALRNQIVSTLQHEFRTPLTFILGYAEYLAEVAGDEVDLDTLRTSITAILEGGHRLQNLIEKFLMLADMQNRDELPGQSTLIGAHALLQNTMASLEEQAETADIELVLLEGNAGVEVKCKMEYLHEALKRVLENAIEYRRPESSCIWLSVERREGYVGLRVKDEGPGIAPEALEQLQRPFEQPERNNRTKPGAGLSLALVQHIARLHGGHLQIESEVGAGSCFTIWLPEPNPPASPKAQ